ncbi:3'-5' exonuclease [Baaleninema simplex]|uniref:3'-5' exonuclease n=1 Tax=Baaleninema simplex TaxID=2862350 RepID=UPI00034DD7FD|nr:3'-5' exonuclease [Baaleninema simplex]
MLPTTLLILDLETTGTDPNTDRVIELGAILYSITHRCVLQQLSTLFSVSSNAAESINRIPTAAAQSVIRTESQAVLFQFQHWLDRTDYVVAHNAQFDRQWFGRGILPSITKPWLCTYDDFRWPENDKPRNLVQTALNHGIGVSHAHRALTDCQLIAALFDRVADFEAVLADAIARSQEPFVYASAKVSYERRDEAKSRGFRWNEYLKKQWVKRIRRSDLALEQPDYPFEIAIVHNLEMPTPKGRLVSRGRS